MDIREREKDKQVDRRLHEMSLPLYLWDIIITINMSLIFYSSSLIFSFYNRLLSNNYVHELNNSHLNGGSL